MNKVTIFFEISNAYVYFTYKIENVPRAGRMLEI